MKDSSYHDFYQRPAHSVHKSLLLSSDLGYHSKSSLKGTRDTLRAFGKAEPELLGAPGRLTPGLPSQGSETKITKAGKDMG